MIGRVVEIAEDGRHLAVDRGFMTVRKGDEELGRVPLDDIGVVVVNAHGASYTNNLLVALAERNAGLVICGSNHKPVAWLWPVVGNHAQGARMRAQMDSPRPLRKRVWQSIVKAKIAQQGSVLGALGRPAGAFSLLQHEVGSGDPKNVEAQAARRYWPLLLGDDFRRDHDGDGANGLLNYGYTVLRSATARAICAAGLHPSVGVNHRGEDLALADDLMEPFRPMVDLAVVRLLDSGVADVTREAKRELATIGSLDMRTSRGVTPLSGCLERLAASLGSTFESGRLELDLPFATNPLELPQRVGSTADDDDGQDRPAC